MDAALAQFERTLAFHCAPALTGAKPADLISRAGSAKETERLLRRCAYSGVCLQRLGQVRGRSLILVYRPDRLSAQLAQPSVRAMLGAEGYPVDGSTDAMLTHLSRQLARPDHFPHEVGLFLGYPPADVAGFRANGGKNSLYTGLWKVYSDVEGAKAAFRRCRDCREALCRRVLEGRPLAQVLSAFDLSQNP